MSSQEMINIQTSNQGRMFTGSANPPEPKTASAKDHDRKQTNYA